MLILSPALVLLADPVQQVGGHFLQAAGVRPAAAVGDLEGVEVVFVTPRVPAAHQLAGEILPVLLGAVAADAVSLRVTVVDNASSDGSFEDLPAPPGVALSLIRNGENRGFAASCNQGAAGAEADLLLFLNPDTRLEPGSLERPARYLQEPDHAPVGIVGIRLIDASGRVARNTTRAPSAASLAGMSLGLDRLMPAIFPPLFATDWAHVFTVRGGKVVRFREQTDSAQRVEA